MADSFFERTRDVYLARAKAHPERIIRVDSTQSIDKIRADLSRDIDQLVDLFIKK